MLKTISQAFPMSRHTQDGIRSILIGREKAPPPSGKDIIDTQLAELERRRLMQRKVVIDAEAELAKLDYMIQRYHVLRVEEQCISQMS